MWKNLSKSRGPSFSTTVVNCGKSLVWLKEGWNFPGLPNLQAVLFSYSKGLIWGGVLPTPPLAKPAAVPLHLRE